ncbi:MAG: glycosyltransferase [Propionicimonas sp.]|nr:glycosyltransferase [Propionicimonas sp.]
MPDATTPAQGGARASVVIAAHNEEAVIARTLDALVAQLAEQPAEVIVSANGCTDDTAAIAARAGVAVIDRPDPGKAGALNAAEELATGFPRIYLDADIVVPPGGLAAVVGRVAQDPPPLAVVPRRSLNTAGRPWLVRAYFAINERHPAFRTGLFGRGMIAVSRAGRARFDAFPAMVADDLFLDGQFADTEKAVAQDVVVVVETPFTTRDLMRRLVRVRRGSAQIRAAAAAGEVDATIRKPDRWGWLREVVAREPRLAFAAVPYLGLTVLAAVLARRPARPGNEWGRDESTRQPGGRA